MWSLEVKDVPQQVLMLVVSVAACLVGSLLAGHWQTQVMTASQWSVCGWTVHPARPGMSEQFVFVNDFTCMSLQKLQELHSSVGLPR